MASWMLALALGCAYPRRTTSLVPVREVMRTQSTPADVWTLTIVGAQIPPQQRGARPWDEGGGLPDPYVRIYRDGELVFETPTASDTLQPEWNVTLPRNLYAPGDRSFRFEMWDRDEVGSDPIGIYRNRGLPSNVVPDADARILLEGGAQLALRLSPPRAHRGVGIRLYEMHDDALVVLEVETHSPAGRAGIAPGDAIVAIGGEAVSALGSARAAGALSMAAERRAVLRVRNGRGEARDVTLDGGYVWLTM